MTGVLVLTLGGSLLLHPLNNNRLQKRIFTQGRKDPNKSRKESLPPLCDFASSPLRLCVKTVSDLFVMLTLDRGAFIWFLGKRFTGDAILAFDPLAQVDELAPFRTEGTNRIVFPIDWFTAGWAFNES